jgi:hypothetical protein
MPFRTSGIYHKLARRFKVKFGSPAAKEKGLSGEPLSPFSGQE